MTHLVLFLGFEHDAHISAAEDFDIRRAAELGRNQYKKRANDHIAAQTDRVSAPVQPKICFDGKAGQLAWSLIDKASTLAYKRGDRSSLQSRGQRRL
jgi:hypothetical protein